MTADNEQALPMTPDILHRVDFYNIYSSNKDNSIAN